jgi:pimeloyl-ACP methyl ester carboxylesterase
MPVTTPAGPMRHDETVITVAGSPVRTYRAGAGAPLVLLHGGGLDDAQLSWAPIWPALTGHARLLAPDLPGYGGSPLGDTAPTLEGYRTWLLAFLDAAGIQTAVVVGMSLGGGVALRTVLDAPARVAGLVLLAPYGISPRLPGGKSGYLAAHAPHAAATTQAALRHSDRLLHASLHALLHQPGAVSDELAGQVRALLARPCAGAAWSAFQRDEVLWTRPRTYLTGQLAAISCPALLLSGEYDRLVPPGDVRAAATRIPQARFALVAGARHWLPRDAPGQVAGQLIAFLAAAPAAPAALADDP